VHSNSLVSTRREEHENAQQEENEALVMLGRGKKLYLFEIYVWRPPFPLAVDGITMGGQEGLVGDAGFRHTFKQTQGYSKVRPITQQVISFNKTSSFIASPPTLWPHMVMIHHGSFTILDWEGWPVVLSTLFDSE
jgi:hypothetical protein